MKKLVKFSLLVMACALLIPGLAGCGKTAQNNPQPSSWKSIQAKHHVVIGLDDSFVPMGFRQKMGSWRDTISI